MDVARIERSLGSIADVMLVERRVLRQVLKLHRGTTSAATHEHCYAILKAELRELSHLTQLPVRSGSDAPWAVLLVKPTPRQLRQYTRKELEARYTRDAFHARAHIALESRAREGGLDERTLKLRIEQIGLTEFAEIRSILLHDDAVLPPAGDLEVYIEFCAVFLELSRFAPQRLVTTFPGLEDPAAVAGIIEQDIGEADELSGAKEPLSVSQSLPPPASIPSGFRVGPAKAERAVRGANRAKEKGAHARAMLRAAMAANCTHAEQRDAGRQLLRELAAGLRDRLLQALGFEFTHDEEFDQAMLRSFEMLAERAADHTGWRKPPAARALGLLERAVLAHERPGYVVDLPSWLLSFGARPAVRPRLAGQELFVARRLHAAAAWAHHVRTSAADRARLASVIERLASHADYRARQALEPRFAAVLRNVGLRPRSGPEYHAREKLTAELLDQLLDRGFMSLPQLRDGISRNELKLDDLAGTRELWQGDALLRADAQLTSELDAVYRRGEIYLRALQKLSSVPFGTRIGRAIAMFIALPLLGAFTILEGAHVLLNPVLGWVGIHGVEFRSLISFAVTSVLILALLHSHPFRLFARQALEGIGLVLAWVFLRLPKALFSRPMVRRWLALPSVRLVIRRILLPSLVGFAIFWFTPPEPYPWLRYAAAFVALAISSWLLGSRVGWWLEDFAVEQLAPTWQVLSRQWIPELLRLIGRTFAVMMERLERGINRIDEALRFTTRGSGAVVALAAVGGTAWGAASYVLRLYVTLLVEPEINPLKHFPVVTVAHKVMLPFLPDLYRALEPPLLILGPIIAGAITSVTVFLLPSVFGFLAWELKENYRLYQATRSELIGGSRVGPHGETLRGLLVVGLHSGTLPKLYERLRRAAERTDQSRADRLSREQGSTVEDAGVAQFRAGLAAVQAAVARFAQRELPLPLSVSPRWQQGELTVERVDLSSNRIRISLGAAALPDLPCELTFEQLGGRIVASVSLMGFLSTLSEHELTTFENVLAVFYQRAEVDLVREQVEAELGPYGHYEIADEGLVVTPTEEPDVEVIYRLDAHWRRTLSQRCHGKPTSTPPALAAGRLLFNRQSISWSEWEKTWQAQADEEVSRPVPRLLMAAPLIQRD